MTVKDLLIKFDNIPDKYFEIHPILEEYEKNCIKKEDIEKYENLFKNKMNNFLSTIKNIKTHPSDNIIFVVKYFEMFYEDKETFFESFMCYKSEIDEKINNEITLWCNSENNLDHYAYDFEERSEILSCDLFIDENITEIEAACEIIYKMTYFGIDEERNNEEKEKLIKSLDESIKDIENGRTYDIEEVFERLENKILDEADDDEKEQIIKERKERKEKKEKNKDKQELYSKISNRINHKISILVIEKYYLEKM